MRVVLLAFFLELQEFMMDGCAPQTFFFAGMSNRSALLSALLLLLLAASASSRAVGGGGGRSTATDRQKAVLRHLQDARGGGGGGGGGGGAGVGDAVGGSASVAREGSVIGQIVALNRQLRERQAAYLDRLWLAQRAPRVVVVANRLPVRVQRGDNGELLYSISPGGMVSALLGVRGMRMIWVGWAEIDDTTAAEREQIRRTLWRRGCVPVFLTKEEARLHYAGFCNDVLCLWPLFHYVVSRMPDIKTDLRSGFHAQWEA